MTDFSIFASRLRHRMSFRKRSSMKSLRLKLESSAFHAHPFRFVCERINSVTRAYPITGTLSYRNSIDTFRASAYRHWIYFFFLLALTISLVLEIQDEMFLDFLNDNAEYKTACTQRRHLGRRSTRSLPQIPFIIRHESFTSTSSLSPHRYSVSIISRWLFIHPVDATTPRLSSTAW